MCVYTILYMCAHMCVCVPIGNTCPGPVHYRLDLGHGAVATLPARLSDLGPLFSEISQVP